MNYEKIVEQYLKTSIEENNVIKLLYEARYYSIGKQKNSICFIIKSDGGQNKRFNNGDMSISINSQYIVSGIKGLYSIIFFHSREARKIKIFIETLSNYAEKNSLKSDDLFSLYNDISEVFKTIKFSYSKFIGNIGELVFIWYMHKYQTINMVEYYQGSEMHLVDFKYNEINFEIKTSINGERKHHINNDQIKGNGYLCSILIKEQNDGMTIEEIYNQIKSLFTNNIKKQIYFENYLLSVPQSYCIIKFDVKKANSRFYLFNKIPKIKDYDDAISEIKYVCNLSNISYYSIEDLPIK